MTLCSSRCDTLLQPEWGMTTVLVSVVRASRMMVIFTASHEDKFHRTPVWGGKEKTCCEMSRLSGELRRDVRLLRLQPEHPLRHSSHQPAPTGSNRLHSPPEDQLQGDALSAEDLLDHQDEALITVLTRTFPTNRNQLVFSHHDQRRLTASCLRSNPAVGGFLFPKHIILAAVVRPAPRSAVSPPPSV